jgi:hypothetical protein
VVDPGVGVGVAGGYRLHPNIAVEGLFQWLGTSDIGGIPVVKRWDATANVRVSTSGRVQPYAVVGGGYGSLQLGPTPSVGGFVARFGGGLDVYVTNNIALYTEVAYMLATGDIDGASYATLGLGAMLRF